MFVALAYLIFDPPGWVSHLCERPSRRRFGLSQQGLISASVAEFPYSKVCQVGCRFLCRQLNFLRLLLRPCKIVPQTQDAVPSLVCLAHEKALSGCITLSSFFNNVIDGADRVFM